MKINYFPKSRRESGYSGLFITLVLVGASTLLLGSTLSRTMSNARLNDRANYYVAADGAAEAAVEKVVSQMMVDFTQYGEARVIQNVPLYQTGLLPSTSENPYWTNFAWSDGQGNSNQIYVASITTNATPPFVALQQQYAGLFGNADTYRVLANVSPVNSSYLFTNAVAQDVQLAQIPVFQFAIFYNSLLEFSDCAQMVINGRVNANSNIYVGCISSSSLTFNYPVTCSGNISSPANDGIAASSWVGPITYAGTPSPGYLTGQPVLTLPIGNLGNAATNVHKILELPDPTDVTNIALASQRYYNKAGLTILVSNSTYQAILKTSYTNNGYLLTNSWITNWFTTNVVFYDQRENKYIRTSQIDIGKLNTWLTTNSPMTTNATLASMFGSYNPLNIIYVADFRDSTATNLPAVRLTNGASLPTNGLTIATPNPLYILGIYNCPNSAYQNQTNTTQSAPASVICDALTILSPLWSDATSLLSAGNGNISLASADTVNTAIIAGIVYSTGTGSGQFSGGVHNLPRLLENWGGLNLTMNTSMVNLYPSIYATNQFVQPGLAAQYYAPPSRQFNFDQNYSYAGKMPPGTPVVYRLVKAAWCNPPPNVTSWSNNWDFAAR